MCNTDYYRLKQILVNLCNNAIKFTNKGHVTIGAYVKEKNIIIYVKDTGIGISKEKHSLIFERFRQVDETLQKNTQVQD